MSDTNKPVHVMGWDKANGGIDYSGYVTTPLAYNTSYSKWQDLLDKVQDGDCVATQDGDIYQYSYGFTAKLIKKAPLTTKIKRRAYRYMRTIKQSIGRLIP